MRALLSLEKSQTHLLVRSDPTAGLQSPGPRILIAGGVAAGASTALGTFVVRAGRAVAGKTGLSEREAQSLGLSYFTSYTHSPDHAEYLPGSRMMGLKLVAEKRTGRLLGAQVAGEGGVDKRLDVFATALAAGMTARSTTRGASPVRAICPWTISATASKN